MNAQNVSDAYKARNEAFTHYTTIFDKYCTVKRELEQARQLYEDARVKYVEACK